MKKKSLLQRGPMPFLLDMVVVYFEKKVGRAAAELSYFLVLTVFPILICINAFFSTLNLDFAELLGGLDGFLPAGVTAILTEYVSYLATNQSSGLIVAGLFTTILLAAAAVRSLMDIMEEIYGSATFHGLRRMAASFAISVLLLAAIYLSIAVVLTGNWFFNLIEEFFHLENLLERFGTWQWMKYLLLLAMVFLVILLLYRLSAPLGKPRPPVITGAFLASVALAAASILFSYFIGMSTRYSLVYGSLASVMILLVWLYLCGNILILGNVFNYVWYTRKRVKGRKAAS